jgi:hypothetical protein
MTKNERAIKVKFTEIRGSREGGWTVHLVSRNQGFRIATFGHDKRTAGWYQRMLVTALRNLIEDSEEIRAARKGKGGR